MNGWVKLDAKVFCHGHPVGISEMVLDFSGEFGESVAVTAKHIVLTVGHVSELTDGMLKGVDPDAVGCDGECLSDSIFVNDDGAGDEISNSLKPRIHEHGDDANEVEAREEVGDAENVACGGGSKGDWSSVGHPNSDPCHLLADRHTIH